MSNESENIELIEQESERHGFQLPLFTAEQAQALAQDQVQRAVIFTGSFLTRTVTVLTSALSLVAALAWNKFITDWLPTVDFLSYKNPLVKELAYAITSTVLAVIVFGILGVINARKEKAKLSGKR